MKPRLAQDMSEETDGAELRQRNVSKENLEDHNNEEVDEKESISSKNSENEKEYISSNNSKDEKESLKPSESGNEKETVPQMRVYRAYQPPPPPSFLWRQVIGIKNFFIELFEFIMLLYEAKFIRWLMLINKSPVIINDEMLVVPNHPVAAREIIRPAFHFHDVDPLHEVKPVN